MTGGLWFCFLSEWLDRAHAALSACACPLFICTCLADSNNKALSLAPMGVWANTAKAGF